MNKKITYTRINSIDYECPVCRIKTNFNLKSFIIHLNNNHADLSNKYQSEMIADLSLKITHFNSQNEKKLVNENNLKQKELKREKSNLDLKTKVENKEKLDEFKKLMFKSLEDLIIKPKIVKQLYLIKNLDVLKHHIMIKLNEEHHKKLSDSGLDFKVDKKKRKLKDSKIKFFDKVMKSIKPIYTPMGNKR